MQACSIHQRDARFATSCPDFLRGRSSLPCRPGVQLSESMEFIRCSSGIGRTLWPRRTPIWCSSRPRRIKWSGWIFISILTVEWRHSDTNGYGRVDFEVSIAIEWPTQFSFYAEFKPRASNVLSSLVLGAEKSRAATATAAQDRRIHLHTHGLRLTAFDVPDPSTAHSHRWRIRPFPGIYFYSCIPRPSRASLGISFSPFSIIQS